MKKSTTTLFAAVAAASLSGVSAYAGSHTVTTKAGKPVQESIKESCITGDIGFNVVSADVRRGIVFEKQGFIFQPYADLHFRVYKDTGLISSVTVDLGIWESFNSVENNAGRFPLTTTSSWFESNFTAGVTVNVDKFGISPYFRIYQSPADYFDNAYVIGTRITYDDTDLLGAFALHPYARVELNVINTTGNGNFENFLNPTRNVSNGQYYEIGVTPAYGVTSELTVSLPIKAGFGSGGYYLFNRGFGFFSVGVDAAYSMNFVPECLGKWTVHAGVTYVRLGGNNDPVNRAGAAGFSRAYPGSLFLPDENQFVYGGGINVAF